MVQDWMQPTTCGVGPPIAAQPQEIGFEKMLFVQLGAHVVTWGLQALHAVPPSSMTKRWTFDILNKTVKEDFLFCCTWASCARSEDHPGSRGLGIEEGQEQVSQNDINSTLRCSVLFCHWLGFFSPKLSGNPSHPFIFHFVCPSVSTRVALRNSLVGRHIRSNQRSVGVAILSVIDRDCL